MSILHLMLNEKLKIIIKYHKLILTKQEQSKAIMITPQHQSGINQRHTDGAYNKAHFSNFCVQNS